MKMFKEEDVFGATLNGRPINIIGEDGDLWICQNESIKGFRASKKRVKPTKESICPLSQKQCLGAMCELWDQFRLNEDPSCRTGCMLVKE